MTACCKIFHINLGRFEMFWARTFRFLQPNMITSNQINNVYHIRISQASLALRGGHSSARHDLDLAGHAAHDLLVLDALDQVLLVR
eukprot:m.889315 g.889315  ORF g.889315 m.889315 type:complete len:86 (+) comp59941_c0_seq4:1258-1515(+)